MNIKPIRPSIELDDGTNQQCIDCLEELLGMAKSGEIVSIICAGLMEDGSMVSSWASHPSTSYFEMIGAAEMVKHEYADALKD